MADLKAIIESGKTALGIEFGSTRIKAVLIDESFKPIASGSYSWENQLIDGFWTYSLDDLTRISRQLDQSMGSMMYLIDGFAVLIFVVLMYLLSKIIIEKNAQSISMNKILGYTNSEISRLYIISTFIVVAVSILISMPLVYEGLVYIFRWMLINSMSGWIPIYLGKSIYVKMFIMGVVSYGVVALLEYRRIQKIPMDTALKNVE